MNKDQIQVYGTGWCPDTTRARQCLDRLKVHYTYCDIDRDQTGCAFVEKVNGGKRRVPTIVLADGSILVEPAAGVLEQKLGAGHRS